MQTRQRYEFETTDHEQARVAIAAAYADNRLRLSGSTENFHFAQSRTDLGEVRLDTFRMSVNSKAWGDPVGCVVIVRMLDKTLKMTTGHQERHYGRGDVFFANQPDQDYIAQYAGSDTSPVGLDLSLFDQVGDEPGLDVVRRFGKEPVDPRQARLWQRTVDFVQESADHDGPAASSPLVLGAVGRLLTATAVSIWDPDHAVEHPHDRPGATSDVVRRAVAYIETNPDLDISVADIARAARVGVRALQLAFRHHLHTTPLAYLRRVRLDLAHADLQTADPSDGTTVTAVAARWGFPSSSRFSTLYRAAYGCSPGQTLRA